jgi:hypothetical protein
MAFINTNPQHKRIGIDIKCNAVQKNYLIRNIKHVEGWPDDENRIRFHFKDGRVGPWFSREWKNITYGNVTPK